MTPTTPPRTRTPEAGISRRPDGFLDVFSTPHEVWELFHENSKTGRFADAPLPEPQVVARMEQLAQRLAFPNAAAFPLPAPGAPFQLSLDEAIRGRVSARSLTPVPLGTAELSSLLHSAYGVTRTNRETDFPRPFRTVPSAGALYPLDVLFHSVHLEELPAGLFHFDPLENVVRLVRAGDHRGALGQALVEESTADDAAVVFFIAATFERSTFKYGSRGYRFLLLEAGHLAQNLNLAATGLGLGCLNIGGYFDREIDELLGLDGVLRSAVYLVAVGGPAFTAPPG